MSHWWRGLQICSGCTAAMSDDAVKKGAGGSTKARWNKKAVRGKEENEVRLVGSGKTRQIAF